MKTINTFWKRICLLFTITVLIGVPFARPQYRKEIRIPDIPGYKTLKCDFHIHTVFSDGNVWPTIRVREAWANGLDAIAMTDHLEYSPHGDDIKANRNRSYDIVKNDGDAIGLIIIHGAEITKKMPPGHLNAIFIQDAEPVNQTDWHMAVKNAIDQGAFVFWNHPGWKGQQPDGVARWYDEHTELLSKGWMRGMEIVNDHEYYPQAQRWCTEKKLTLLANSDMHDPVAMAYDAATDEKRPITLVFAREKSEPAIKEALFARRTAVLFNGDLFGEADYLRPILDNSVQLQTTALELKGRRSRIIPITNTSDLDFHLVLDGQVPDVSVPSDLVLRNNATVLFGIRANSDQLTGQKTITLPYKVTNLRTAPEESLPFNPRLSITFVKEEKSKK